MATLRVLEPGLFTLLVDAGRPRSRSLGVPVGGAADRASLALGNALVGNPPDTAALEIALVGPTLEADCTVGCVVFGAPINIHSERQPLNVGKTFTLFPGERLTIGGTRERARAYLCVCGGFDAPTVLGSRSALQPLRAGDELPIQPSRIPARFVRENWCDDVAGEAIRCVDGPQADWFQAEDFFGQAFVVSAASNRMGLRLEGRPLTLPQRELVSEPVCPGSVQVTRDGQCIVLGVDGQTIGGYPKVAQVISADHDRLGQLRPGERVRFQRVGQEEAGILFRSRETKLQEWLTRLLASGGREPPVWREA